MKTKLLVAFAFLCVAALGALILWPESKHQTSSTSFSALSGVPVLEIPATAAQLVHAAPEANREDTAREVVRAVGAVARPGALAFVVSSICRGNPEVSGAAVGAATALEPEDVLIFCKTALTAAPSKAYFIVYEACQAAPKRCVATALAASKQIPSATDLIQSAFANARPEFEPFLEKAQIQVGPNFEAVLKRTVALYNQAAANHAK